MKQSQYYTLLAGINLILSLQIDGNLRIVAQVCAVLSIITSVAHTFLEGITRYKSIK